MYNHYIPQSDGSYLRSRHPEKLPQPENRPVSHPVPADPVPPPPPQPPRPAPPVRPPRPRPGKKPEHPDPGIGTFLRQLLPKNFDSGDLLVVLLLLLMSGDCSDDQNTALLTLVLYLFL